MAFIIGRDCKNPGVEENLLDYVLAYTVANDISSRFWQAPENGAQHNYAKSFDKFAPLGPVLVSSQEIQNPSKLQMRTRVNGELRQETCTNDMIFDVSALIRHYSNGVTLKKGTVFLTYVLPKLCGHDFPCHQVMIDTILKMIFPGVPQAALALSRNQSPDGWRMGTLLRLRLKGLAGSGTRWSL
jgi:hypothetical protein